MMWTRIPSGKDLVATCSPKFNLIRPDGRQAEPSASDGPGLEVAVAGLAGDRRHGQGGGRDAEVAAARADGGDQVPVTPGGEPSRLVAPPHGHRLGQGA